MLEILTPIPAKLAIPEKFLYHIWDSQHIRYHDYTNKTFKTISGKTLVITFPGHYNTMAGADFKNAIIEIDGVHLQGDAEIHINTGDWYAHGHEQNPIYNSVILHIVYEHNHHLNFTINENSDKIEILEIKNLFSDEIEKLYQKYADTHILNHEKYCPFFSNIRTEFYEKYLEQAGIERLMKKVKRFEIELAFVSFDQLFYQSILEAMGYSRNKYQFYKFAKENTWLEYKQGNLGIEQLVDAMTTDAGLNTKDHNIYDWYLFRIRPCNHPLTRIYQIAPFIHKSFQTSLTTEIQKLFSFKKNEFTINKFKNRVYEILSTENKYNKYKMGKDRINTIIINIFIPILIVYANTTNDNELKELCEKIYIEFPALIENQIDHTMRNYMTPEQYAIAQKKAIYQQGILNIYHQYCINHLCDLCRLSIN